MNTLLPLARFLDSQLAEGSSQCNTKASPRADVLEGEQEFRIVMDLPGVQSDSLEINLEQQALTVKAERTAAVPEGFQLRRNERANSLSFSRTFNLGNAVDAENISAHLDNGVLKVTLPKSQSGLPRRIEVK
ncbi:MAG: HSP20 family protein [Candidatus Krumholzibacteriia bacterium]|jgi:HSP20 family protein